ncbi:MAG: PEP-CTERM sorting domain-containing protein [Verrucomicrobia bacterium]|nr:PEP-CTERM sorting domain-containing protein [Verrucomicrobiota bacterium]
MKKLLLTLTCVAAVAGAAYSQTASFSLQNNGTNMVTVGSTGTFTLNLYGTFQGIPSGYVTDGYSLFLEATPQNNFTSAVSITSATPFQYPDPTSSYPQTFTYSLGSPDAGQSTTQDLGFTANGSTGTTGNYTNLHLTDYTFSLNGLAPGTYTLTTTTASGISYDNPTTGDFEFANAPQTTFTINVVPEPSTWSLLGLGGLAAVGMTMLRRRRA